jgi:hypothetical protein
MTLYLYNYMIIHNLYLYNYMIIHNLYLYNYMIIHNLYLYNYSDSVLTTIHRCISYFPGQAVREMCALKGHT